ncbi:MAG: hypothetical protein AAGD04_01630 [Pseudomonadota bacterium]
MQFDLPEMKEASDAEGAAASILSAVAAGGLTPAEGASVMALVDSYRRTLEVTELEQRISKLEGANQ